MSVLVEFAMFPTDKGESVSSYVSRIIKLIDESGIPYKLTPMGTVFETETVEEALELIGKAYEQLEPDCNRVYSVVKFDIRKGKSNRLEQKIKSVEEKLGREVSK
ncbi:MAG: MTH1187 family thiamine-binding protein [Desulfurobacteriaceae bacterium]